MADLGGFFGGEKFDVNDPKNASEFDSLPGGDYKVVITNSEEKTTKSGDGKYLALTLQVVAGEFQNRKIFENLNFVNNNETAVRMARATWKSILVACRMNSVDNSCEVHGIPMILRIAYTEKLKDKNNSALGKEIKENRKFLPCSENSAPPPSASAPQQPATAQPQVSGGRW